MKRIICFTESLGGGGAEHQIVLLAGLLEEKGYDVSLVTYASLPDHYDTPKRVNRIDIGFTRAKGKMIKALIKAVKVFFFFLRVETDCVIAYRECANLRVLPPLFFRSHRIRVVCSDRNTSKSLSLKHKLLLHVLYRRADFIVPNSNTEAEFIIKHKPELRTKIRIIHNYTDLTHFVFRSLPSDITTLQIGIFSRFSNQKNPFGLAEAISVLKNRTSRPFEVHWYGFQEADVCDIHSCYSLLIKHIERLRLGNTLMLHPAVKDPANKMEAFHAICLPSFYEGFSNSVAEGICSGRPMIVSNVSDNPLMVHEGENGFLFEPDNITSICKAFLRFFNLSFAQMEQMASKSRRIAEDLFNKELFITNYIDLIES